MSSGSILLDVCKKEDLANLCIVTNRKNSLANEDTLEPQVSIKINIF